jgi:hypothetical protein
MRTPLRTALERLAEADILLVQDLPPDASVQHALIQGAATLRNKFAGTAAAEPELRIALCKRHDRSSH